MKKALPILLFLNFLNCFSQEIIDVALSGKTKLISENVYQFHLKNNKWDIKYYLYTLDEQQVKIDTLTFVKLINKSLEQNPEKWKKEDFKNTYLIKKGEMLSSKKVLLELGINGKKEIKSIKRQIRQYNNRPSEWRGWPMSISKPIFSNDKQFCIIGFKFGNNGGYTELYKIVDSEWKQIGIFNRFAY